MATWTKKIPARTRATPPTSAAPRIPSQRSQLSEAPPTSPAVGRATGAPAPASGASPGAPVGSPAAGSTVDGASDPSGAWSRSSSLSPGSPSSGSLSPRSSPSGSPSRRSDRRSIASRSWRGAARVSPCPGSRACSSASTSNGSARSASTARFAVGATFPPRSCRSSTSWSRWSDLRVRSRSAMRDRSAAVRRASSRAATARTPRATRMISGAGMGMIFGDGGRRPGQFVRCGSYCRANRRSLPAPRASRRREPR